MDNISDIQSRFRLTKKILQCISSHLSGREDCKGVTYIVEITDNSISCKQPIYVYPDRYHRKDIDKEHIIHHIIEHHFPEFAVGSLCFFVSHTKLVGILLCMFLYCL